MADGEGAVDADGRSPEAADPLVQPPAGQAPLGLMLARIARWVGQPTPESREAIENLIPHGTNAWAYTRQFSALIVLSASIAAFGLLSDSSAVVIGAMLVAPLMTPIAAAAAAIVTARNGRLLQSAAIILLGTLGAIGVGYFTSAIVGFEVTGPADLQAEILGRTSPGLLDLGVAISAGAAAGYILPRRSAFSALPGVGIAVALVPPLATTGICAQLDLAAQARGALLLYVTNLAAIVFTVSVMLLVSGFRPDVGASGRSVASRLAVTTAAVVSVAVPLTLHTQDTLRNAALRRSVTQAVDAWDDTVRVVELSADVAGDTAEVEVLISGPNRPQPSWRLAEEIERRFDGPVDLRLLYQQDEMFVVSVR
jgi:uncharacterized hydrophobic protein (TIGR00271 family)